MNGSLKNRALVLRQTIPGLQQAMTQHLHVFIRQRQQRVDEAAIRITHGLKSSAAACRLKLPIFEQTMAHSLRTSIAQKRQVLPGLKQTMAYQLQTAMTERKQKLKHLDGQLRALNPLGVLQRGYSLTETADGTVVRNAADLHEGDRLKTRFADGCVTSEVIE